VKPQISRVKLEPNEAVLKACKANPGDSAGQEKTNSLVELRLAKVLTGHNPDMTAILLLRTIWLWGLEPESCQLRPCCFLLPVQFLDS